MPKVTPTFDNTPFDSLLTQYNNLQTLPSTVDLTQAFLMTSNMTAAANTNMLNASFDTVTDYYGHADSLAGSMLHVSRLLQGAGPSDRSSNFFIAQKQFQQAKSFEDSSGIRDAINSEIVDGLEYQRQRELIALARQRAQHLMCLSDEESHQQDVRPISNEGHREHLRNVCKQLRSDAWTYLGIADKSVSLSSILKRLRKNKVFKNKRQLKA